MAKQSSAKMSSMAASYLAKGKARVVELMKADPDKMADVFMSLCGGVVSNDETKGQGKLKRVNGG